ncbi:MAG: glutaminyl-peptide cyclotransferase [Flavobacteriaceae bacterium]
MGTFKAWALGGLSVFFLACGSGNTPPSELFEITLGTGNKLQNHSSSPISIQNKKNRAIEKVTYFVDGVETPVENGTITLKAATLGNKQLTAKITHDGTVSEINKAIVVLSSKAPELYTYEIINEYPHDTQAYTQGLEFHEGVLYESTGKRGRSSLRKVDFKTGEVLEQVALDNTVFGEGLTIMNNKVYQLTWQKKIGYIYELNGFQKIDNFHYGESKEGWGLCNNGSQLFKSDGTERIWILNPDTLVEEGHIEIATNKSLFKNANELEYVDGKIYANVYQKSGVMIIDPKSGAIEGVVNFGGLSNKVTKTPQWNDHDNVLNGIAYHPERKTFFVTGKDWDKLFEVTLVKK